MVAVRVIIGMMFVTVRMRLAGIGTRFGVERRLDSRDRCSEVCDHLLQYMIAADADSIGKNLRGHMTIADVPSDAREKMRIAGDLGDRFRGGNDAYDTPAIEHESVAVAQVRCVGEVEQEVEPALARHCDASTVSAVVC
jgi:hypothetical protein